MKTLEGKVAFVAGSSRGAGRGIALALGDAGATVYIAARTSKNGPKPADGVPGTVEDTADEVTARGGKAIAVAADLSDEAQVAQVFQRVQQEHGRLDLLASAVWYSYVLDAWGKPFWDLGPSHWRDMQLTEDAHWHLGRHAARMMAPRQCGLMVFVTDLMPDPSVYYGQMMWDVGHHTIGRLIVGMSHELKQHQIAVVGMNPGFMRTERVLSHMRAAPEKERKQFRFDLSESVEYVGRAVAALAADPEAVKRTGQFLWAADLAREFGFTDIDGRYIPRFDPKAPAQEYPESWLNP